MDWNKTQTLFIIVFLILDIFLLYQYIEKKASFNTPFLSKASDVELLKLEGITYDNLPKHKLSENYLIAKSKDFTKEADKLKELKDQKTNIINKNKLTGKFDKKIKFSSKNMAMELETFLKENILYGKDYRFWSYDKEARTIVFYQYVENKMFYNNSKGKVTIFIDDKNNMISYEQTYLVEIEKYQKERELQQAESAIISLYLNGDIAPKSDIQAELGYYNSLQAATVSQLLVPTWRIIVNGELDLFVNAFDGEVIELNTEEKILE